jgi:Ca2+/H+ antiporter
MIIGLELYYIISSLLLHHRGSMTEVAVIVANLISLDDRSNWLDRSLLLAIYFILAADCYFLPI